RQVGAGTRAPLHGPDWCGDCCKGRTVIAHKSLAIVDPDSGGQPLYHESKDLVLGVKGVIYNHLELWERLAAFM
ncbi:MAG: hypothetical protein ACKPKO_04345, partial [Candidatus Fonsibacter sp.]